MKYYVGKLIAGTLCYLAVPWLIFVSGWLSIPWALALSTVSLILFRFIFKEIGKDNLHFEYVSISRKQLISIAIFSILTTIISGVGELVNQNPDYFKHNLIFSDLVNNPWPVTYNGGETFLCYNIAYYLPAALLGKIFGLAVVPWAALLYSFVGTFLFFTWFFVFAKTASWKLMFVFICISGLELVWVGINLIYFTALWYPEYGLSTIFNYVLANSGPEITTPYLGHSFFAVLTNFIASPQHGLSGYLAGAMVLYFITRNWHPKYSVLAVVLLLLWSPLTIIGFAPFLVYHAFKFEGKLFNKHTISTAIVCLLLGSIGLLYLQAHYPLEYSRFIWQVDIPFFPKHAWVVYTLGFIVFEFGLIFLFLYWEDKKLNFIGTYKPLFAISFFSLVLLCMYQVGIYNDLSMRASVPFLFVLLLVGLFYLQRVNQFSKLKKVLIGLLIVGMVIPRVYIIASTIYRTAAGTKKTFKIVQIPKGYTILEHNNWLKQTDSTLKNNYFYKDGKYELPEITNQYLGTTNSVFYQYFAKQPKK
jgi:hypothetical protein